MLISRYKPNDFSQVYELLKTCHRVTDNEKELMMAKLLQLNDSGEDYAHSLVAKSDAEGTPVIGFAHLNLAGFIPILSLVVLKDTNDNSVAITLISHAEKIAQRCSGIDCLTIFMSKNSRFQADFFLEQGYYLVGPIEQFAKSTR